MVINPNSSERITNQIRDAVGDEAGRAQVEVVTSAAGPAAIESDEDVVAAVAPMLATVAAHPADAYVVACFSDPGLDQLRRAVAVPAVGIAEAAMRAAMGRSERVGVISSVEDSLPRHARYWSRLGIEHGVAGDIAVVLGVLELGTAEAYQKALAAGRELVAGGAGAIVLGCTGMTHMQAALQDELGVAVVDPCRVAVAEAARLVVPSEAAT